MTVRTITGFAVICDSCKSETYRELGYDRNLFIKRAVAMGWYVPAGGYAVRCKCPECKNEEEEK